MRATLLVTLLLAGAACGDDRELWWCDCTIAKCDVAPAAEAVMCASTTTAAARRAVDACETTARAEGCAGALCECACAPAGSGC